MRYDYVRISLLKKEVDGEPFDERIRKLSSNGYEIKASFESYGGYVEILLQRLLDVVT